MLQSDGFMECIQNAWSSPIPGNPFKVLTGKLKLAKAALIQLNSSLGNLSSSVKVAKQELHIIQNLLHSNPLDHDLLSRERLCSQTLWKALDLEESLLQQKSRAIWLKSGDKNSKYFSNIIKSKWNHNKILSICNSNGDMVQGQNEIEKVVVDYFTNLLGSNSASPYPGIEALSNCFSKCINPDHASALTSRVTDEEIFAVLNSMKRNKSPGPDGFNVNFFIHCWDIMGTDFTNAVHFFFHSCNMPKGINSTAIALIPKVANPSSMADFRPISCCNTIYKCISKILANRLKKVLPSIIDPAQSAFVQGRSISDNILLAQELFRNYHRNHGPPRCALKIDIRKAFDTVH